MNIVNRNLKIFFTSVIALGFILAGCKKNDGPIKKEILDRIDAVPTIATTRDGTGSLSIDLLNLAAFKGKFTVSPYFEKSIMPEKVDVVVRRTSGSTKTVKLFKADVATLPATFTVTSADLQKLFGTIVLGDQYDFSVDIYANGKKYEAFPLGGVGSASGPLGMPGYSEKASFGAICAYIPDLYQGDFVVVTDEFEDTAPGDIVTLTKIDNTHFSYNYPSLVNGKPIIVTVNPGDNSLTIEKQTVGTKFSWAAYTNPTIQASGVGNSVAPCDETVNLNVAWSVDQGGFGSFKFILKKKH